MSITTIARSRRDIESRLNAHGRIELPRATTFVPFSDGGFKTSVRLTQHNGRLLRVDLVVHGRMTFGTDEGTGWVNIVSQGEGAELRAWTDCKRWKNGVSYTDMPQGARRAVAAAVLDLVGDTDWPALVAEEVRRDRDAGVRRLRERAEQYTSDADELAARPLVTPTWSGA